MTEIEKIIEREYNRQVFQIDHYTEMEKQATSQKGKSKWRHFRRIAQKLKDDYLAFLYTYQEGGSVVRLVKRVIEAIDERRRLIVWLAGRRREDPEHGRRAQSEINALDDFLTEVLIIDHEERFPTPHPSTFFGRSYKTTLPDRRQRSGKPPRKPLNR